jgi:hypothetical protein
MRTQNSVHVWMMVFLTVLNGMLWVNERDIRKSWSSSGTAVASTNKIVGTTKFTVTNISQNFHTDQPKFKKLLVTPLTYLVKVTGRWRQLRNKKPVVQGMYVCMYVCMYDGIWIINTWDVYCEILFVSRSKNPRYTKAFPKRKVDFVISSFNCGFKVISMYCILSTTLCKHEEVHVAGMSSLSFTNAISFVNIVTSSVQWPSVCELIRSAKLTSWNYIGKVCQTCHSKSNALTERSVKETCHQASVCPILLFSEEILKSNLHKEERKDVHIQQNTLVLQMCYLIYLPSLSWQGLFPWG